MSVGVCALRSSEENEDPMMHVETDQDDGRSVVDEGESPRDSTESISTDEVFALLSNERRRNVLKHLSANGGEVRLRELATAIAAEENGVEPVEVTYAQRKRLYTSLYQSHLPRMERSGVVEHDRNSGVVTLAPEADAFDAYLEVVGDDEFTWSEFYLGLAGLFAVMTLAYATGTPPFGAAPAAAVMGLFVLLLAGSALVHVRRTRQRRI